MVNINPTVFEEKEVRRVWHNEQWFFCIVDIVQVLTDSIQPEGYIKDMRRRDEELFKGWGQIATPLSVETKGGIQKINCANLQGIFRIIQSISSPKAEPFKQWLAKVGQERIEEIQDPELATKRTRALYKAKGYSDAWIEKRMRGIEVRETLTDEWKKRGVKEGQEYAILTAEISRATFGMTPSQYQKLKGLKRENLRDHMNDLELIFAMLGEASTTEIARNKNTKGFLENKIVAKEGGTIAGEARKKLELKSGKKVSTGKNYLPESKKKQKLKSKNT
jgi:hypothetical protein